ncbi:unnamed protein product [Schistocephalus solidus]|uniref:Protein-tyrosine-phosphatase n=1 Tax=Schistocephalus solidus TaxID=70667 RepID=A0A183S9B3_SCHSO|nr:unnamed protein product [Schistocephalus solidus]
MAVQKNELNVYWTISKLAFGTLAPSRAIAIVNEKEISQCSARFTPHACVLSQLNYTTEYTVVIDVCVTPPDPMSSQDFSADWCLTTTGVQKKSLRESTAEDVRILAVRTNELNFSWSIPNLVDGKLESSRATAIRHKKEVTICSANCPRSTCFLSQLNHSTEYIVVIEVCVIPPDALWARDSSAAWCSRTAETRKTTLQELEGKLASSRAIVILNEKDFTICSANGPKSTCVLSQLNYSNEYRIFIEVCVTPPDAVSIRVSDAAWCSKTPEMRKTTVREFPARAEDVRILAVRTSELNVSWTIPNLVEGKLESPRAIGMLDDFVAMQCTPDVTMDGLVACILSGMAHSTEYKVFIELCVTPADAMSPSISSSAWCSKTDGVRKETLPQSPENATSVTVRAVQGKALTVSWINPNSVYGKLVSATATASLHTQTTVVANCWVKDVWPCAATCILFGLKDFTLYDVHGARIHFPCTATHGVLSSSKAVAILNEKTEVTCSGIPEANSPTSCSLNGLKDLTNYTIRVRICVYPVEEEPGYWAGDGCSSTSPIVKQTLPGGPDVATITVIFAHQRHSLEISWLNPDATHGPLAKATAICFWQGNKVAICQADILPGQAVTCTLTKLVDFEEYAIFVEVCVAPAQAEFEDGCDGVGGCSRTPTILGSTLFGGKAFKPPRILHLS